MTPLFAQHSACKYCAAKAQLLFPERVDTTRQDTDFAAECSGAENAAFHCTHTHR